ncbi:N-formylglutamate amidohydrolase [Gellertiella hungarica]|uniref:Putative N-formylglutamate amidohydrolase n=1 Tax=Gellertiella hungarica TaxID=1572859 RepID=A0A7W6J2A9_9HYPH|nr:N-formylglutamate amidohydrolase [Gellertiella hungarica]MBB4063479.1 putative N-formylglutamate amidohydrolase [Gellertiella hungarica]
MHESAELLTKAEGSPAAVVNAGGKGPVVLVCEHASRRLPETVGTLGLSEEALVSHIAWDPGALAVAEHLSSLLDAPLVYQRFSRLVYDCNRPPEAPGAMPETSEIYDIPGNRALSQHEKDRRTRGLYLPFHAAVSDLLDERGKAGLESIIVTMHSFTPVYMGRERAVEIGILHDEDSRVADAMLIAAEGNTDYDIRRNEPYGPADGVTHTLIKHGLARGLKNVMIEVRNDLIRDEDGQRVMAGLLAELLGSALKDRPNT